MPFWFSSNNVLEGGNSIVSNQLSCEDEEATFAQKKEKMQNSPPNLKVQQYWLIVIHTKFIFTKY